MYRDKCFRVATQQKIALCSFQLHARVAPSLSLPSSVARKRPLTDDTLLPIEARTDGAAEYDAFLYPMAAIMPTHFEKNYNFKAMINSAAGTTFSGRQF